MLNVTVVIVREFLVDDDPLFETCLVSIRSNVTFLFFEFILCNQQLSWTKENTLSRDGKLDGVS